MKSHVRVLLLNIFVLLLVTTTLAQDQASQQIKVVTGEVQPMAKSQQKIEQVVETKQQIQAQHTTNQQTTEKTEQKNAQPENQMKITIADSAKTISNVPEPVINSQPPAQHQDFVYETGQDVNFKIDPLQENVIQKQQVQLQQQELKAEQKKLHPWVAEQFEQLSVADQIQTHQIFAEEIVDELTFKWNPSEFKSGPLKFVIEVYDFNRGQVNFPDNPEQDDYLEVFSKSDKAFTFTSLGKVYIKKLFTINFFEDYQIITIKSMYNKKMLIQISLQATKFVPEKALADDSLKIPAQKIKTILQELEQTEMKRQKTYRSEWNFRDRQEHHQSEMLILTGVELIIILGTAIVQMYCIKNLFDNRLIV